MSDDQGSAIDSESVAEEADTNRRKLLGLFGLVGAAVVASGCSAVAEEDGGRTRKKGAAATTSGTADVQTGDAIFWADTITQLRATNGSAATPDLSVAIVCGAADLNDGGGGVFRWIPGGTPTDDGGITIVPGSQATNPGYWYRQFDGPVNVRWFMGRRVPASGSYNHTPVIQAAVDAAATLNGGRGVTVFLPAAIYECHGTINIRTSGIVLTGEGQKATMILFVPTAATDPAEQSAGFPSGVAIAFNFDRLQGLNGSLRLGHCGLRHMGFQSQAAYSQRRVAVRIANADNFTLEDVFVENTWTTTPNDVTGSSIGVQVIGGQFVRIRDVYIHADRPISVDEKLETHTLCDHLSIENAGLSVGLYAHDRTIRVSPRVRLTNFLVQNNNWAGGAGGLFVESTTDTAIHQNIAIRDVRAEQMYELVAANHPYRGHVVYLEAHTTTFRNVVIDNVSGPGGDNSVGGLYLNNVGPCRVRSCDIGTLPGLGAPRYAFEALGSSSVDCVDFTCHETAKIRGGSFSFRQRGSIATTFGFAVWITPRPGQYKQGIIRASVFNFATPTPIHEAGVWAFSTLPLTSPSRVVKISGTANTDVGIIPGKLTVDRDVSGNLWLYTSMLAGGTTGTVDYIIETDFRGDA